MITELVVGVAIGAARFIFGLLPEAMPMGVDGFGAAVAAMKALNAGLPITETIAMAMMCLAIIGGIFATRLVLMIYDRIPFKFT